MRNLQVPSMNPGCSLNRRLGVRRPHGRNNSVRSRICCVHPRAFMMSQQQPSPRAPVSKDELWSSLLTTMPGINDASWWGRVGEWVSYTSPSTSTPTSHGSLLHMWRLQHPQAAAVSYFQAQGLGPGAISNPPPAAAAAAAGGGGSGSSEQGGEFVWDQAELGTSVTSFVFTPEAPQLELVLPSPAASPSPDLIRGVRLLPLSSGGVAIFSAGLPPGGFSPDLMAAQPPGSFWFVEVVIWHRDVAGDMCSSAVGLAWDWASGALTSHRYYWQKETTATPLPPPATTTAAAAAGGGEATAEAAAAAAAKVPAGLGRLAIKKVRAPAVPDKRPSSYAELVSGLPPGTQGHLLHYTYSPDDRTLNAESRPCELQPVTEGEDQGLIELWYPSGGAYARVPRQLNPALEKQEEGGRLVLEVGALCGSGPGFTRCRLEFSTSGDCTIQAVTHETYPAPQSPAQ